MNLILLLKQHFNGNMKIDAYTYSACIHTNVQVQISKTSTQPRTVCVQIRKESFELVETENLYIFNVSGWTTSVVTSAS